MSETADEFLVGENTLVIDRSLLARVSSSRLIASIDRGSTLTKIMYSTSPSENSQSVTLHLALFRNKHFDSALQFLKARLATVENRGAKILHVTGVGSNLHGDKIKQILGVATEFIDEAACQFFGFHFLLKHFQLEEICHPAPEFDDSLLAAVERSETFQRFRDAHKAALDEQSVGEKFPCLFALYGSSAGIILMKEDGSIEVKHRHLLAGKSFLGLCQLLIGTGDYAEIMRLASAGKRGNIDTQVRDILNDTPNSPYGRMPPSLAFFTFGKAVDFDRSLEETRREDIAHSLVSAFTINFVNNFGFIANFEKIKNIFFGGNFFEHEMPRIEAIKNFRLLGIEESLNINFLKTGHTAALGAMLSSSQDVADLFADMRIKS